MPSLNAWRGTWKSFENDNVCCGNFDVLENLSLKFLKSNHSGHEIKSKLKSISSPFGL